MCVCESCVYLILMFLLVPAHMKKRKCANGDVDGAALYTLAFAIHFYGRIKMFHQKARDCRSLFSKLLN